MRLSEKITSDRYSKIEYHQFTRSRGIKVAMAVAGVLCWPVVLPLALLSRTSDFIFRTVSETFALIPFLFGVIIRYEFLRWTLTSCGENVSVGFGTVFLYRDIRIGDNVLIGNFNSIHHCDFGSYVLAADGCRFLSGSAYHDAARVDIPMALPGGKLRRIVISDDCWIGTGAIVMNDVGEGCIVGAGSVLTKVAEPYTVVAGNPAKVIRKRD